MKLIVTLILSGVVYIAASPTCTDEGIQRCLSYDPRTPSNPFVETGEDLDSFCKSVTCLINFQEVCGEMGPGADMKAMFNHYKVIFNNVCDKSNMVREKYLENAECLNKEVKNLDEKCPVDGIEMGNPDFCKSVTEHMDCSYDVIEKECGKDARDVYTVLYPGLEFFGCGVAYATASPTCSQEEFSKCSIYDPESQDNAFPETKEDFDQRCKLVGCVTDYLRRCGVADLDPSMQQMVKHSEVIYNDLCGEQAGAMRQKYFRTIKCINGEVKNFGEHCKEVDKSMDDPEFCPLIAENLDCTRDVVHRKCDEDALEVYNVINPGLEYYDCKK